MRRAEPATAWYERGRALERTDVAAAKAAYRRAVAGHPDLADAHCNLGRLHHDDGELADAEACYRLAACAAPAVALYWFNLGVVVEDRGGLAEAIAHYEHALELDPALADAHYNLARICELVGRRGDSDLAMRRAIRHLLDYRAIVRPAGRRS
jgi:tetratricopeptide (TPR) repeat protein